MANYMQMDSKSLSLFNSREVWEGKPGEIEGLIRDWVTWQLSSDSGPFIMLSDCWNIYHQMILAR